MLLTHVNLKTYELKNSKTYELKTYELKNLRTQKLTNSKTYELKTYELKTYELKNLRTQKLAISSVNRPVAFFRQVSVSLTSICASMRSDWADSQAVCASSTLLAGMTPSSNPSVA